MQYPAHITTWCKKRLQEQEVQAWSSSKGLPNNGVAIWVFVIREAKRRLADIRLAHQRYCQNQQENSKTSAVLKAAFSDDFARRYMSEIMFDVPPAAPDIASAASGA